MEPDRLRQSRPRHPITRGLYPDRPASKPQRFARCWPERATMSPLERAQAQLVRIEQNIAAGEDAVTAQTLDVERLRAEGKDTRLSAAELRSLREHLADCYEHHHHVQHRIDRLAAHKGPHRGHAARRGEH